jgi:hypothetical protein
MIKQGLLIGAMAQECRERIRAGEKKDTKLPKQLRPPHLLWMCDRIEKEAEQWPISKLHRWIGFIQCAMMANGLIDFASAKDMFQQAKNAYADNNEDLTDHLDITNSYRLDIGGEG